MKPLDQNKLSDAAASFIATKVQKNSDVRTIMDPLIDFVYSVPDLRRSNKGNIRHVLGDIILLMIFARMCKCITRVEIIEFGKNNLNDLNKMGLLMRGVPSEATLCRIENGIDDLAMADRMRELAETYHSYLPEDKVDKEIICVDGKAERGTIQPNGRSPDIVSAYSPSTGIILATEACEEKSNEIKAVPRLLRPLDIAGAIITADAMSMQKDIIGIIKEKGADFLIELKANQRSLRYGIEDKLKVRSPVYSYTEGPELAHGRIETRTYHIYDGLDMIEDKEKWGGNMTVIKFESVTVNKSTGAQTTEERLYVTSLPVTTPRLGDIVRTHWSIESMHWGLDRNLAQDATKRKTSPSARNLDTIHRIIYTLLSVWKRVRKKRTDKAKGMAELIRYLSGSFTRLKRFLNQKLKKISF